MNEKGKATLSYGDGKTIDLPVYGGSLGPDVIDIRKLYGQTGMFTYDPGFFVDCIVQVDHYLYRWRQG